jgi:uncharacterized LabA/DUF88 family protein
LLPTVRRKAHWWVFLLMKTSAESEDQPVRVGVFIDWQNCYRTARDAFGFRGGGIDGNVKPLMLAKLLAAKRREGQQGELTKLRIYTGRASQRNDPRTYAANRRQFAAWQNSDPDLVEVVARTLDYSLGRAREKGVDVALAIDLVRTSLIDKEHDVALVVSADTDLLPALELLVSHGGDRCVEVASWKGPHWAPQPLSLAGRRIVQHELTEQWYRRTADSTNYGETGRPAQAPSTPYGRRLPPRR